MRASPASTTLATALTIPVNIPADEYIVPEPDHVHVCKSSGFAQEGDSVSAEGAGSLAAADQPGRDVGENLVDEAFPEKGCLHLGAPLDQDAQDFSPAQLVDEVGKRHPALGSRGQL